MICLDNTDTLEGGASVDAVVDYTVHGLVGSTFTVLADGQLSDTDPSVLYTAGAAISIVSITLVNTHTGAVNINLYLDSADGGNPRRMIPKDYTLDVGSSLHFDGQRCRPVEAVFSRAYVKVSDTKAESVQSGGFTSGAWRTRDINTEDSDDAGICSIAANQITLETGTYICSISCPGFRVDGHKTQLYNISDTSQTLLGTAETSAATDNSTNHSSIVGQFTIAAQKVFEVQHQCGTTKTVNGFGNPTHVGGNEVYTTAEFWRI